MHKGPVIIITPQRSPTTPPPNSTLEPLVSIPAVIPYTDHIVQTAKYVHICLVLLRTKICVRICVFRNRLQELETESEQLDRSFRTYLHRQSEEKVKLTSGASKIWENYSIGKQLLSTQMPVPLSSHKPLNYVTDFVGPSEQSHVNQSAVVVDKIVDVEHRMMRKNFENPYRKYENALLLKSPKAEGSSISDASKGEQQNSTIKSIQIELERIKRVMESNAKGLRTDVLPQTLTIGIERSPVVSHILPEVHSVANVTKDHTSNSDQSVAELKVDKLLAVKTSICVGEIGVNLPQQEEKPAVIKLGETLSEPIRPIAKPLLAVPQEVSSQKLQTDIHKLHPTGATRANTESAKSPIDNDDELVQQISTGNKSTSSSDDFWK